MLSDEVISSSPSWPPLSDFNGSLFDLSSIMAELPIKRGLSKYFEGKSQSFGSLSDVRCTEDLAKEESPRRTKMKTVTALQDRVQTKGPAICRSFIARQHQRRFPGVHVILY
ncbi:unnamed protein product [Musa hybrid cultivar]